MEYVDGLDLGRLVKSRGPLPVAHACNFVYQAATGLHYAYKKGLVHRDIKPGNLMLSSDAGRAVIKILDFGLAKATREQSAAESRNSLFVRKVGSSPQLTIAGQTLGTPGFLAPEQAEDPHRADIRADIFSLGCTLYFLLTGHPPVPADRVSGGVEANGSTDTSRVKLDRRDVPAELVALVARMMARKPAERFQTPEEVATGLLPFFKKSSKAAGPAGPAADASPPGRESPKPEETAGSGWESLVRIDEDEEDADDKAASRSRPAWAPLRWPALAVTGAALLVAVLLGGSLFRTSTPPSPDLAHLEPQRESIRTPPREEKPARKPVDSEGPSPPPPGHSPKEIAKAESNTTGGTSPPKPATDAGKTNPAPAVTSKPRLPTLKTPRRRWIRDVSLAEFQNWVEVLRSPGYRPLFVGSHRRTNRFQFPDGVTEAPGAILISSIDTKDGQTRPFEVRLKDEGEWLDYHKQMQARGLPVDQPDVFRRRNPSLRACLTVYSQADFGTGFYMLPSQWFPASFPSHVQGAAEIPFFDSGPARWRFLEGHCWDTTE